MAGEELGPPGWPEATPDGAARARVRGPRLTFHASVLLMTLAALVVMAVPSVRQLYHQRAEVQAAEQRLEALRRTNARLDAHLARLKDPVYLEKVARKELGLVRPGEIGFVVVPDESAPQKEPAAAGAPWYERVMRSLGRLAGR
jgi:cell division protein DivIC